MQMQRKVLQDLLNDKNAEVDVLYEVSLAFWKLGIPPAEMTGDRN